MSSATFTKLKAALEKNNTLTPEEIAAAIAADGAMTDAEQVELEALKIKLNKQGRAKVSMEDYVKASKILDTAPEGSPEYKAAEAIVEAFESGG
jgi:hypothetical protein